MSTDGDWYYTGDEVVSRTFPSRMRGCAATPGTGTEGEKCGTCRHMLVNLNGKDGKCYLKYSKDILSHSPACRFWGNK